jgi:calcineurin-like phosphoesterase family protein
MREKRGFATVEEMNEQLIENWNSMVTPKDEVFYLGDLSFEKKKPYSGTLDAIERLNGTIHFYRGNHEHIADKLNEQHPKLFASYQDYGHIKVYDNDTQERNRIILCHYSFQVWDSSHHGSWNLYGHSHDSLPERGGFKACDVGVDSWKLFPVKYETLKEKFDDEFYKYYEPIDHHTKSTGV